MRAATFVANAWSLIKGFEVLRSTPMMIVRAPAWIRRRADWMSASPVVSLKIILQMSGRSSTLANQPSIKSGSRALNDVSLVVGPAN